MTEKQQTSKEEQFMEAYDLYVETLFRHCYFRVSDRERALELVQETYTKAWNYVREGKEIQQWKPFLFRTLSNLIIDEYRKKKQSSLDALLEQEHITESSFEDLQEGDMDAFIDRLDAEFLKDSISVLPDIYQEVISLRFIDGLSPQEIGEMIDESENVVSVRVHRGLKKLREYFDHGQI